MMNPVRIRQDGFLQHIRNHTIYLGGSKDRTQGYGPWDEGSIPSRDAIKNKVPRSLL